MKNTLKNIIRQNVIKNLLSAHKRIADEGNPKELIRITRFLLKLAEKFEDVLVEFISE